MLILIMFFIVLLNLMLRDLFSLYFIFINNHELFLENLVDDMSIFIFITYFYDFNLLFIHIMANLNHIIVIIFFFIFVLLSYLRFFIEVFILYEIHDINLLLFLNLVDLCNIYWTIYWRVIMKFVNF